ncbi:hypothetical protein EC957_007555 [Mortierella hygrophila]|uniref:Uncharacterized protein n=1 Tax=Mortierella hygrophila TaxID=979708 RepID=A0A9P6EYB5_9FUNG|nr:hypothetical protein EC957_007555 [Mortierella hygrophila]
MTPTTRTLQETSGRHLAGPSIQTEAESLHPERANHKPKAALDSAQTKMLNSKRPNEHYALLEMMESLSSTAQLNKGTLKRLLDLKGSVHDSPNRVAVHDNQVAASA